MENNLKKLLKKINLDDSKYKYFEKGILESIVTNDTKDSCIINIDLDSNLPLDIYIELIKELPIAFSMVNKVCLKIRVKRINVKLFYDYLEYFVETNNIEKLKNNEDATYKNKNIVIEIEDESEKLDLEESKLLIDLLLKSGFEVGILYEKKIAMEVLDTEAIVEIEKVEIKEEKPIAPKRKFESKPKIREEHPNVIYGRLITDPLVRLDTVIEAKKMVTIEAFLFGFELRELKTKDGREFKILNFKITDYTDSIYGSMFLNKEDEVPSIKAGAWYKFRAQVKEPDKYNPDITLNIKDINTSEKIDEEIIDDAPVKRVELHTHTLMSQMDGLCDEIALTKLAHKWGHAGIAITDHNCVQSFPHVYKTVKGLNKGLVDQKPFKGIYGTELTMIDDTIKIVVRPTEDQLLETTFVVFDLETTGFNAGGKDSIIEIGAVKICNGEIIDRFDELIDPGCKLSPKITEITNITDEMLKGKMNEEEAMKLFIAWFKDTPMVAHNAKFDVSFIEMAYTKYNLGKFKNTVVDTLELSRTLDNNFARHSLSALVKRYDIKFDEEGHHRADYDSEATAYVYHKMMKKLVSRNMERICDLDSLVSKDEIHKYGRPYHVNILALNKKGLKNLFKIISFANTTYLYKTPRILRSKLEELREGLLIGSGCYESEVFIEAATKSDEELTNIISFYDYVEVQPLEVYDHLLQTGSFASYNELLEHVKKIVRVTEDAGKIIVATGDVHHIKREDKMYREIITNQKVPGGGRHPLSRKGITSIPSQHFRTTKEMLEDFKFLGDSKAYEIVVENTNKIADMIDVIEVIIETNGIPFSPKIDNSVETVNELVYGKAKQLYGDPLPNLIKERIEQELKGIIGGGFDVIYLIAQKLVKKSNNDGYLVGSRGSVGSSFVATMMDITEVNPLPAHYCCPKCQHSIFEDEKGTQLGAIYSSGFDLPDLLCPKCNTKMLKDGQDMPFATFLGFNADKVPDIDLNFSGLNQATAHDYTKTLFGVDNVYRAGTIGTVADKTAFGYVKGFCEDRGIIMRTAEVERRAMGCTGVKRTTGQHPGGIVVIPGYMDVFDFTPFQYPADDPNSVWRTTHFDYHAIEDNVLKLDILGHDDPTVLRMLQDLSGIDVTKIDLGDSDTMKIFSSPEILGVTKEQIMCPTGTLGVPEMGTDFVIQMLVDTKPKSFSELIKISGLSHGTDVWIGNAQELIKKNIVPFNEVIGCRDDIMVYLMYHNVEPIKAFKIMEFVRRGKPSKEYDEWQEHVEVMRKAGIAEWFIDSCFKIKYMFPKAHAAAYVMSAFRIAWFKVHHPLWYYCSYFSIRYNDFDIDAMIKGYTAIKSRIIEISNKGYETTNKENSISDTLKLALEATARGIKFGQISIMKSENVDFVIAEDNVTLIPPFRTIDGLGDTVARNIVEERVVRPFLSIEDLQRRCKVSSTLVEKMRLMGILDGMDETNQLSLF